MCFFNQSSLFSGLSGYAYYLGQGASEACLEESAKHALQLAGWQYAGPCNPLRP